MTTRPAPDRPSLISAVTRFRAALIRHFPKGDRGPKDREQVFHVWFDPTPLRISYYPNFAWLLGPAADLLCRAVEAHEWLNELRAAFDNLRAAVVTPAAQEAFGRLEAAVCVDDVDLPLDTVWLPKKLWANVSREDEGEPVYRVRVRLVALDPEWLRLLERLVGKESAPVYVERPSTVWVSGRCYSDLDPRWVLVLHVLMEGKARIPWKVVKQRAKKVDPAIALPERISDLNQANPYLPAALSLLVETNTQGSEYVPPPTDP